jgi:hypothetical protein
MARAFIAHSPGTQDRDTYRQFQELQDVLAGIQAKINTRVNVAALGVPVTVTEQNSPLTVLTMDARGIPVGWYSATVNFRSRYVQANDQLIWEIAVDINIGPFIVQSVVSGEEIPFSYGSTFRIENGSLNISLVCSTSGPGAADVEILAATLSLVRVMGDDE